MEANAMEDLRGKIKGQLLLPGDVQYDEARSVWNAMIDRRPAAIVRCLGTADVLACVAFARANGIPLSIKGGGHNISGLAVAEGGLMIDMSMMRGVWVDTQKGAAVSQPGCLLSDIDRETQIHNLAAVLGFVSNTGAAGLTLGGGFGYLTRRFGWTSDNLLSVRMITADGRIVRASENENADLFWALRGGGGNFGVVTSFEHRLYPVGPEIIGGAIAWPFEDAQDVLEAHREITRDAPPEFACVAGLRIAPPAPWLPKEIHGKPIALLLVCDTGRISEAEKQVEPLKRFGNPVGDIVQRRTYTSQQSLIDATQPNGRRYYWKSEYFSDLDPKLIPIMIEHAKQLVSPHSAILLFPLGGALNGLAEDHSAVGNRNAKWVLNIAGSWEKPEDDQKNIDWARAAWRDMLPFSTGGTYINFLTEDDRDDRVKAAYGKNYERLTEVKTRWDPTNFFHANKNIKPRA